MNIKRIAVLTTAAAIVLSLAAPVSAASPAGPKPKADSGLIDDNLAGPLARKQQALKVKARDLVAKGKATANGKNKVVKVAKGQFVELAFEGEDQILTLLSEFGTAPNNAHPGHPAHNGTAGPNHNEIPEPDRTVDNTTIWTEDFSQSHYDNLLYNKAQNPSMANWYLEQSYGQYSVDGYVSDWVEVPFNAAAYGSNYCGSIVCTRDIGRFLVDQTQAWWDSQIAASKTPAQIDEMLAPFDVWDRNDYDADGDFDEPDGFIDHFQSVHAGEGEETGGGAQGTDAIWSHRSYANAGYPAPLGPKVVNDDGDVVTVPFGGLRIGGTPTSATGSKYWIGDYTIEPENGGVGVFAHEFGHDLGLPDEYDTSGNTGGAENSTAWWTPWSQGSYGTVTDDLGSAPVDATIWEKWVLGWVNLDVAHAGKKSTHKISASEISTKAAQGVQVILPDKVVNEDLGDPHTGSYFYDSDNGDELDNTMTRSVTLGAGPISASFWANYHIEPCWDYAYFQVSTDGGTTFTNIDMSASTDDNSQGQNFGNGITGISGTPLVCNDDLSPTREWVNVTADLSAYANSTIQIRFRYWTDGATVGDGFQWDDLAITGQPLDGGETDLGWTYDGFRRTTGILSTAYPNYYFAEYRTYMGYDAALELGPYNFTDPAGNWVEHFPYQDGLLIWYYDASQHDNNVGDHPGEGLILPIDAHPDIEHWSDGSVARPRLQSYDSTFGLQKTDAISIPSTVFGNLTVASKPAVKVFNDNLSYYRASDPADAASFYKAGWSSVNHPHTGTVIKINSVSGHGAFMHLQVTNK